MRTKINFLFVSLVFALFLIISIIFFRPISFAAAAENNDVTVQSSDFWTNRSPCYYAPSVYSVTTEDYSVPFNTAFQTSDPITIVYRGSINGYQIAQLVFNVTDAFNYSVVANCYAPTNSTTQSTVSIPLILGEAWYADIWFDENDIPEAYSNAYYMIFDYGGNPDCIYTWYDYCLTWNSFDDLFNDFVSQGYDEGYAAGYQDGQTAGYNEGYAAGFADGQSADYKDGYDDGYRDGYQDGYDPTAGTYEDGYDEGYNIGYNAGYEQGYIEGELEGEQEGYEQGYNNGYNQAIADGASGLISNPVAYFIEPVRVFLDTDFFGGFSYGDLLSIVIFVSVACIFLKMFAGG